MAVILVEVVTYALFLYTSSPPTSSPNITIANSVSMSITTPLVWITMPLLFKLIEQLSC